MAKIFGINTKISGKVGQYIYRQTRTGTVVSEAPVKPVVPLRTARQMNIRTQWANLGAIFKAFNGMLRKGFENLPSHMSVYNAFIQANLGLVKVYITRLIRLNGGSILAPYQITRGSLPSITLSQTTARLTKSSISLGSLNISATTTIGQLAAAILENNPDFEPYDQLTCFIGSQALDSATRTPRTTIKGHKIILDPDDTTVLWSVVDKFGFSTVEGFLGTAATVRDGAIAWVHSREDEAHGILKVSSQFLYVENSSLATYQAPAALTASIDSYGGINRSAVYLQPDLASALNP